MGATDTAEGADMVILNTCHIREKAAEKVYSVLGRIAQEKRARAASGSPACWWRWRAASPRPKARKSCRPPAGGGSGGGAAILSPPAGNDRAGAAGHPGPCDGSGFSGAGKIRCPARGCGRNLAGSAPFSPCRKAVTNSAPFAWCPIPAGPEHSRSRRKRCWPKPNRLAEKGAREIVLLGQNVNAYNGCDADGKTWSLARLIVRQLLTDRQAVARIRYMTSHPRDMGDDLIAAHGNNRKADAVSCTCRCSRVRTACWRR